MASLQLLCLLCLVGRSGASRSLRQAPPAPAPPPGSPSTPSTPSAYGDVSRTTLYGGLIALVGISVLLRWMWSCWKSYRPQNRPGQPGRPGFTTAQTVGAQPTPRTMEMSRPDGAEAWRHPHCSAEREAWELEVARERSLGLLREDSSVPVEEGEACVICLTAPRTVGLMHGESVHRVVCTACAGALLGGPCPICRAKVERLICILR